jgi:hypothetical protein
LIFQHVMTIRDLLYILIILFLGLPFLNLHADKESMWMYASLLIGLVLFILRIVRGDD